MRAAARRLASKGRVVSNLVGQTRVGVLNRQLNAVEAGVYEGIESPCGQTHSAGDELGVQTSVDRGLGDRGKVDTQQGFTSGEVRETVGSVPAGWNSTRSAAGRRE